MFGSNFTKAMVIGSIYLVIQSCSSSEMPGETGAVINSPGPNQLGPNGDGSGNGNGGTRLAFVEFSPTNGASGVDVTATLPDMTPTRIPAIFVGGRLTVVKSIDQVEKKLVFRIPARNEVHTAPLDQSIELRWSDLTETVATPFRLESSTSCTAPTASPSLVAIEPVTPNANQTVMRGLNFTADMVVGVAQRWAASYQQSSSEFILDFYQSSDLFCVQRPCRLSVMAMNEQGCSGTGQVIFSRTFQSPNVTLAVPTYSASSFGVGTQKMGNLNNDNVDDFVILGSDSITAYSGATQEVLWNSCQGGGCPLNQRYDFYSYTSGIRVATAAIDLNGDQVKDLVGVNFRPYGGSSGLFIHDGVDGHTIAYIDYILGAGNVQINPGNDLTNAGDVDNDGADDLMFAAYDCLAAAQACQNASVAVVSGRWIAERIQELAITYPGIILPLRDVPTLHLFSADASYVIPSSTPLAYAVPKIGLSSLGDVDGDGKDDVAFGEPFTENEGRGHIKVCRGGVGSCATIVGETIDGRLGSQILGPFDLNGDQRLDILATNYPNPITANQAQVISGVTAFTIEMVSGNITLTRQFTVTPSFFPNGYGTSIAFADVNADGRNDVIVGNPAFGVAPNWQQGALYAYHLDDILNNIPIPRYLAFGAHPYDGYGDQIIAVGDRNNDGYEDILVTTPGWQEAQWPVGRAQIMTPFLP